MDRSVGALRKGLRDLGMADRTLLWFCSDNGGLPKIQPDTTKGLRAFKGSLYEGGIRVPAIVEWPERVPAGRHSERPAVVMDIFPTVAEIVGFPSSPRELPQDGQSILGELKGEASDPRQAIPFHYAGNSVWIDYPYKLMHFTKSRKSGGERYELYHLENDPKEAEDLSSREPERLAKMKDALSAWLRQMEASVAGKDYPEGRMLPGHPEPRQWNETDLYTDYFDAWRDRPEYRSRLQRKP